MIRCSERRQKSETTTTEDKIIAVCGGYLELYDTSLYFYKNGNKKDLAWKKVSEGVGQSGKL